MDATLFSQLGVAAVTVAILLGGMRWMAEQLKTAQPTAAKERTDCEARNAALNTRVTALEERQFRRMEQIAEDGIRGMNDYNHLVKRLLNEPITPPHAVPAIRDHERRDV